MQFKTTPAPFILPSTSIHDVMLQLIIALMPAVGVMVWLFGEAIIIQLLLASIAALAAEALCLRLRAKAIKTHLLDMSALITGLLLALSIPSLAPWWISVVGVSFAIIIGKHVYGGLGHNPFNPAMVGYVFLLISFPQQMTAWQIPHEIINFNRVVELIFCNQHGIDAITAATFLDSAKTALRTQGYLGEINYDYLWLAVAYFIGGMGLLARRVIRWQIPAGVLLGLLIPATVFYLIDSQIYHSPWQHLISGATMCAAFFIATDPVSAATSQKARFIYGLLIGLLIYIIRTWGAYPDGVAFAVLLANLTAPSLDYLLRPKRESL